MGNTQSFEQLIERLAPTLQELEEQRKELKKKANKKILRWSGVLLIIAIIFSFSIPIESVLIIGALLLFVIFATITTSTAKPLQQFYKKQVISNMVECLLEKGHYDPDAGISESAFNQSNLFTRPDRYSTEDRISGIIDKTSFCFAEVHAEEKHTNSKGKTRWETIFKGLMFIADFHKNFSGQTIVCRDSFIRIRKGRVKLENTDFEGRFDVFSSDQVEARYLLSPSMMERIIDLDEKFGGGIVISFSNSKVMIAIKNSTNHFECNLWKNIDYMEILRREYDLIISMIGIVDELNLNTRIWSKE